MPLRRQASPSLLAKRLVLNEPKLRDVITGIDHIAKMEDPVGRVARRNGARRRSDPQQGSGTDRRAGDDLRIPAGCRAADRLAGNSHAVMHVLLKGGREAAQHQCGNRRQSFEKFSPGMGSRTPCNWCRPAKKLPNC